MEGKFRFDFGKKSMCVYMYVIIVPFGKKRKSHDGKVKTRLIQNADRIRYEYDK